VPYRDDAPDLDALAGAARATGAPLVYLANPDNPTGTWHRAEAVTDLVARLPEDAVLCLDEAYADVAPRTALPPLDPSDPRVIRMRTFSKAHGLAGLRVGYALGHPELIAAFDRVRNHFGMGRVAQAGALAALGDTDHLDDVSPRSWPRASGSRRSRRPAASRRCPRRPTS
jgi:histidinol-phosphate aminotransferase